MIEYLKGTLTDLTPTLAVVECSGVGYGVNISLNTYAAIQGKQEVKVWIYEAIREDAYQLWGFSTKLERELFLLLITVSGIGASMARVILSAMTPSELCTVIRDENDKLLKQREEEAAAEAIKEAVKKVKEAGLIPSISEEETTGENPTTDTENTEQTPKEKDNNQTPSDSE
jgi:Holliday junction DNA helicase RuvA